MQEWGQDWESVLSESGHRVTASRRAIARVLAEAQEPLSHRMVLERARAFHPELGLVTVYRTLDLFAELGLTRKVHSDHDCSSCMPSNSGHNHALVCTECGAAIEFPCTDDVADLITRIESSTDFEVHSHLLQLSGLCGRCRAAREARRDKASHPSPQRPHGVKVGS